MEIDKEARGFKIWSALVIVGIVMICIVLAFLPFWESIFLKMKKSAMNYSQLRVNTPENISIVYIDGKIKGETKEGTLLVTGITPGKHSIRIERKSSIPGFYIPFEKEVNFEDGVEIEIQWVAGPTTESSEGVLKYFKRQAIPTDFTTVNFIVYPPDAQISWDGKVLESGSYQISVVDDKNHELLISSEGFETKKVNLKVENAIRERHLDVVVEVYLYRIPVLTLVNN